MFGLDQVVVRLNKILVSRYPVMKGHDDQQFHGQRTLKGQLRKTVTENTEVVVGQRLNSLRQYIVVNC